MKGNEYNFITTIYMYQKILEKKKNFTSDICIDIVFEGNNIIVFY